MTSSYITIHPIHLAQLHHLIALFLYLGVCLCGLFISHFMSVAVQKGIIFCKGKGVGRGRGEEEGRREGGKEGGGGEGK